MKFKSYDTSDHCEYETEIRNADLKTSTLFVQTWVVDYLNRILRDPNFSYALFDWNVIIKTSFIVGYKHRCYGAFTGSRIDGLLSLSKDNELRIEFIATAPWNYYTITKMKRIGSGLIYFTIRTSHYSGLKGEFFLNALPDAEKFYEKIGMRFTGKINKEGLKEYYMSKDRAISFLEKFKNHIIDE